MNSTHHNQRDQFLKDYLALMTMISKQQDSLFWWATDISSKNRFLTPLPDLLQEILISKNPSSTGCVKRKPAFFANIVRWIGHSLRIFGRMLWIKIKLGAVVKAKLKHNSSTCVIKSFLYLRSFTPQGSYKDAFFAEAVNYINQSEPVLVLVDIPSDFIKCIDCLCSSKEELLVVPWEYFLTTTDVILFMIRGLCYKPKPMNKIIFRNKDITKSIQPLFEYGQARIQPYQLFHYPACVQLCRTLRLKRFILTYESNPWEKMCILAIRQYSPKVRIIGYQHNVIPQSSANMFLDENESGLTPLPDIIITTGEETKRLLQEYGHKPQTLEVGCALRTEPLQESFLPRHKIQNILVALEGVDDAHFLAQYIIDELSADTHYRVVLRTHPVLPWSYFKKKYKFNIEATQHFSISKENSLKKDILRADVVIYWGSTVGMEAIGLGKPVIHLDNGSLLSFDPLFKSEYFKWVVTPHQSLKETLRAIDNMCESDFITSRALAIKYLKNYFLPVSKECLEKFKD